MKNIIRKFLITRNLYPNSWKRSFQSGDYYYYNGLRATFKKALPYLNVGRALDIGAGFGNEAKVLLRKGFEVTATDTNPDAIKCLKRLSKKYPKLEYINEALPKFTATGLFDTIICEMVLHFLSKEDVYQSIREIQERTQNGGFNVISSYIDTDSIRNDKSMAGYYDFLLKTKELKQLYKGWKIVSYEEKENAIGHKSVRLIAQKSEDRI